MQLAEVKEQAERRIAKLNGALQAAESRCHQLAAEAAAASQSAPAPPQQPPQVQRVSAYTACVLQLSGQLGATGCIETKGRPSPGQAILVGPTKQLLLAQTPLT